MHTSTGWGLIISYRRSEVSVWVYRAQTLPSPFFSTDAHEDNLDHAISFQNRSYIFPDRTTVKIRHLLVNIGPSRIHCSISTPKLTSTRWYGLGRYFTYIIFREIWWYIILKHLLANPLWILRSDFPLKTQVHEKWDRGDHRDKTKEAIRTHHSFTSLRPTPSFGIYCCIFQAKWFLVQFI